MKSRQLSLTLVVLLVTCVGAGAKKEKQPPPTYDFQGDIRWVILQYDAVSTMTYSDGTSTTVHCDFSPGYTDCGVGSGASKFVRFDPKDADAKHEIACCVVAFGWPKLKECSDYANRDSLFDCDPLQKLGMALPLGDTKATLTFRYRAVNIISFGDKRHPQPGFSVPFQITDRKGRTKDGETCYMR